jgi:phosphoketolase
MAARSSQGGPRLRSPRQVAGEVQRAALARQGIVTNLLITALVWRQDHNGFTHQDPGFLDVVANKSPSVVRIYQPPHTNSPLSVADHCLQSVNYVNVITVDKQVHLQYLDIEPARPCSTSRLQVRTTRTNSAWFRRKS